MLVGLFLLVVIWALKVNKPISPYLIETRQPQASATPSSGSAPSAAQAGAVKAMKYGDALKQYSGRVIQFDASCQAHPNSITVKNGTAIMFDNRSGDARWFTLNGFGYHLDGYGYTVVTVSSKKLPATVLVDCGGAQNVGQILVQK